MDPKDKIDAIVKALPRDILESLMYRIAVVVLESGDEGRFDWSDGMEEVYRAIKGESAALAEVVIK